MINSNKVILRNVLNIISLMVLLVIATYWLNPIFTSIFFTALFLFFYLSKNNTFWVAFFFILISAPLDLFYGRFSWYVSLAPNVGIPFYVPLFIISNIKITKMSTIRNNFKNNYKYIFIYICFLILLGLFFGINSASLFRLMNILPTFTLFIFLPQLLTNMKDLIVFNRIILSFSIVMGFLSIVQIISPIDLLQVITNSKDSMMFDDDIIRQTGGIFISLYSVILALYYLNENSLGVNKKLLYIVLFSSILFIINSATRGWILATFTIFFLYSIFYGIKSIKVISIILALGIIILTFAPIKVKENFSNSYRRLVTISNLASGDMTADGTLSRLTVRGPRVLSKFNESPIFGFGYSEITEIFHDKHVGNHSILLSGGIVGFLMMYGTFLAICYKITFYGRKYKKNRQNNFTIFIIGFVGIFVIHSSSMQMFGYYFDAQGTFLISLLITNVNILINKQKGIINDKHSTESNNINN